MKRFGRNRWWKNRDIISEFPRMTEETLENLLRMDDVNADIRKEHFCLQD
jgi:hypothetical protein